MSSIFIENIWSWMDTVELADLDKKRLYNVTNQSNYNENFLGRKIDEFPYVSLVTVYGCKIDK